MAETPSTKPSGIYFTTPDQVTGPKNPWTEIMQNGLCRCTDDCAVCCSVMCCGPCVSGNTFSLSNQGPCLLGCCCACCLCGVSRSYIQNALGSGDSGCVANCLLHWCCGPCATCQEARAVNLWAAAGRPAPSAAPAAVSMQ